MKKLIGIVGLSMAFASTAAAAPAAGTTGMGLGGGIHVTPGDLSVAVSGSYLTFIQDGIAGGGGANIAVLPDFTLGLTGGASYWMGLSDDMDLVAGVDLTIPVTPAFALGANIDVGIAYWLGDNYAATVTNVLGLGADVLTSVDITDDIVFVVVSFF